MCTKLTISSDEKYKLWLSIVVLKVAVKCGRTFITSSHLLLTNGMTRTQYDIIVTVCYSTNFVIQSRMINFFNMKHSSEL